MFPKARTSLLCLILALASVLSVEAQLYSRARPLSQIETERFVIIFPEECTEEASYLASFADESYTRIALLLGLEGDAPMARLPVVISPDSEEMNGSFSEYPYNRISLYAAPIEVDSSLSSFQDDLRGLFFHELVHALSINIRSGFWAFLSALMGDPMAPNGYWMAPPSLIEGVTVSFESLEGHGRARDPLAAHFIRQDIVEGRFKEFWRSSGASDEYPFGSSFYYYGGYFSRYLQESFGMERYAELWKSMGEGNILTGLEGFAFFKGSFEETYGMSLDEAWKAFGEWMRPARFADEAGEDVGGRLMSLSALGASGETLYYVDGARSFLYSLTPATGREEALLRVDGGMTRIYPSPKGDRLLLSWSRYEKGLPRLALFELDLATRSLRDLELSRLREAAYMPDGSIVAIAIENYRTDLVLVEEGGNRVLLRGSEALSFGDPVALEDGRIVFILREGGHMRVARIDPETGAVEGLGSESDFPFARFLGPAPGGFSFAFAPEDGYYRPLIARGDELLSMPAALSGAVFKTALVGEELYYQGLFSEGGRLCAYPPAAERSSSPAVWSPIPGLGASAPIPSPPELGIKPYEGLPWLLKGYRYPIITLGSSDGSYSLARAGFGYESRDPIGDNAIAFSAAYDIQNPFAQLSLSYLNRSLPVSLSLGLSDAIATGVDSVYRVSKAVLALDYSLAGLPSRDSFDLSAGFQALGIASGDGDNAYAWDYGNPLGYGSLSASWSTGLADPYRSHLRSALGAEARASGMLGLDIAQGYAWVAEGRVSGELPLGPFGLGSSLSASFADPTLVSFHPWGAEAFGSVPWRSVALPVVYPVFSEYSYYEISGSYWLAGEAFVDLATIVLDRRIYGLPVYVNSLALRAGYRAAYTGELYMHSAYARLFLRAAPLFGSLARLRLEAFAEVNYALSTRVYNWDWGISLGS